MKITQVLCRSGLGDRVKVLQTGEVVQLEAEGIKFRKGTGKTIGHVDFDMPFGISHDDIFFLRQHSFKYNQ